MLKGNRRDDLRVTGVMLCQLSYEAIQVGSWSILLKITTAFTKLVYLSAMNADVQGTAKWIELNQTGNSCASVQSAFPAVVTCYAMGGFYPLVKGMNR